MRGLDTLQEHAEEVHRQDAALVLELEDARARDAGLQVRAVVVGRVPVAERRVVAPDPDRVVRVEAPAELDAFELLLAVDVAGRVLVGEVELDQGAHVAPVARVEERRRGDPFGLLGLAGARLGVDRREARKHHQLVGARGRRRGGNEAQGRCQQAADCTPGAASGAPGRRVAMACNQGNSLVILRGSRMVGVSRTPD
jgi:hypothetical protein